MPRRKQTVRESEQPVTESQESPASTFSAADERSHRFRPDPFPVQTVDLDGYKVKLQEKRDGVQGWQMQIKFGEGGENDKPSPEALDLLKSFRTNVETKSGESKEVQLFHWNRDDAAWGMRVDYQAPATSRAKAEMAFARVVEFVGKERGVSQSR